MYTIKYIIFFTDKNIFYNSCGYNKYAQWHDI